MENTLNLTQTLGSEKANATQPWYVAYESEDQTYAEEILNTITHGFGLTLIIPAVTLLILLARARGNLWHVIGVTCYGASLTVLYACSTLYHWSGITDMSEPAKEFLRDLDHCAIYFLICGTYTPLILINLIYKTKYCPANSQTKHIILKEAKTATLGWTILISVWVLSLCGITSKLIYGSRGLNLFMGYGFYLLVGWIAIFAMGPLYRLMPKTSFRLLIIGGMSYTLGMIFLLSDALPFNHPVWHMFVFTGSLLHFFSITAASVPLGKDSWKTMEKKHSKPHYSVEFLGRFVSNNFL
eukprot:TRINITY_DN728_c0_g1_i1.p1 TRINITY_DN728_c0_g1~~TRINITY_DN728_c0_g1_i1.p1  ORF type:complete len:298 (+),score=38.72 TRINITY_DN728_c0_g1_i1:276-1169(+)